MLEEPFRAVFCRILSHRMNPRLDRGRKNCWLSKPNNTELPEETAASKPYILAELKYD
jgi:hypothetical protein